jgi:hypothetical protein
VTETNEREPGGKAPRIARMTPYELVFTEGEFESRIFPRIRAEAVAEAVESLNPERFAFLSTAADVVRELTPDDAPADALYQYRALLFHVYHFWLSGRPLYVVDPAVARYLVEAPPSFEGWSFDPPGPAGYVQLPANLFWSSIAADATPEPVDGYFFTATEGVDRTGKRFGHLELLMVLGIRRSRAGFSVIPLETQLGPEIIDALQPPARSEGDFANMLPGGEIEGLYSILTTNEALKLPLRVFAYMERYPRELTEELASEPRSQDTDPPPTHLAYTRIRLSQDEGGSG